MATATEKLLSLLCLQPQHPSFFSILELILIPHQVHLAIPVCTISTCVYNNSAPVITVVHMAGVAVKQSLTLTCELEEETVCVSRP